MISKLMKTDGDVAGLILRVTLALVMFPHATQKLFGWFGGYGLEGTLQFFASLGIPAWLGVLTILIEFAASIALLLGLFGRVAALGVGGIIVGAVVTVHASNGFFMNWTGAQAGEGFEYHLLFLAMAAVVVLKGSGALSVDRMLASVQDRG
jgi:putative oxidoreductase